MQNYPFPFFYPPMQQKTLAEQLRDLNEAQAAIKGMKAQLKGKAKDEKKKKLPKVQLGFLDTLGIVMLFSIPVTLLQIKFLHYVATILNAH